MRSSLLSLIVCLVCTLLASLAPARASVVMTGTRVIYPESASAKTLQFNSNDEHPWLVQVWLDDGDDKAESSEEQELPFIVSPPVFRVEPHGGHVAQLRFVGDQPLPPDRESLFYLNFSQIPAQSADEAKEDANRLLLVHNTKLKLFYRPRGLAHPESRQLACALHFNFDGETLIVKNPAAFYAVVSEAALQAGGRSTPLLQGEVLAPFSQQHWTLSAPVSAPVNARIAITLVNDYGANEHHLCPLA